MGYRLNIKTFFIILMFTIVIIQPITNSYSYIGSFSYCNYFIVLKSTDKAYRYVISNYSITGIDKIVFNADNYSYFPIYDGNRMDVSYDRYGLNSFMMTVVNKNETLDIVIYDNDRLRVWRFPGRWPSPSKFIPGQRLVFEDVLPVLLTNHTLILYDEYGYNDSELNYLIAISIENNTPIQVFNLTTTPIYIYVKLITSDLVVLRLFNNWNGSVIEKFIYLNTTSLNYTVIEHRLFNGNITWIHRVNDTTYWMIFNDTARPLALVKLYPYPKVVAEYRFNFDPFVNVLIINSTGRYTFMTAYNNSRYLGVLLGGGRISFYNVKNWKYFLVIKYKDLLIATNVFDRNRTLIIVYGDKGNYTIYTDEFLDVDSNNYAYLYNNLIIHTFYRYKVTDGYTFWPVALAGLEITDIASGDTKALINSTSLVNIYLRVKPINETALNITYIGYNRTGDDSLVAYHIIVRLRRVEGGLYPADEPAVIPVLLLIVLTVLFLVRKNASKL